MVWTNKIQILSQKILKTSCLFHFQKILTTELCVMNQSFWFIYILSEIPKIFAILVLKKNKQILCIVVVYLYRYKSVYISNLYLMNQNRISFKIFSNWSSITGIQCFKSILKSNNVYCGVPRISIFFVHFIKPIN